MPLTQGCILMGFQAAHENVTLLVLLGFVFFFFSHQTWFLFPQSSLFYKFDVLYR